MNDLEVLAMKNLHTQEEIKYSNKLKKLSAGFALAGIILLVIAMILMFVPSTNDTVKYEDEKYTLIQYPLDIFYYDLNKGVEEYEEDETVPLKGSQWRMVYNNCDVYCHTDDFDDANAYYNNHENYVWYVTIEDGDKEFTYPLEISMEDFEYIYRMEDMDKETAIFFDEIETQGSLIKISKDGFIEGRTGLAQYKGDWYWRTETIDENRERDGEWPEYVIALPDALDNQINKLEKGKI